MYIIMYYTQRLYVAPKPSGVATTRKGKATILSKACQLLNGSTFVALFAIDGVSKEQVDLLKRELPERVIASVIKNSIFRLAAKGTKFEPLATFAKNENIYIFIPEGDSKATSDKFQAWQRELKRTRDDQGIKAVAIENQAFTGGDILPTLRLPSKEELLLRFIGRLKSVGERLVGALHGLRTSLSTSDSFVSSNTSLVECLEVSSAATAS